MGFLWGFPLGRGVGSFDQGKLFPYYNNVIKFDF
jgi:hypothetical protein